MEISLKQINEEWAQDGRYDLSELAIEATREHSLECKYSQYLTNERILLKVMQASLDKLNLQKWEFYTQGPTEEQLKKGWKLPGKGIIMKTEVDRYMRADEDIIKQTLKVGIQLEKIEVLERILKSISKRQFICGIALNDIKFKAGAH
jgi:hypothetical protein